MPEHERHFDLVRQITAELPHLPEAAVDAWQESGPRRVVRAFAGHLRRYARAGVIVVDQPETAAQQFAALISPFNPSLPRRRRRGVDLVSAGVRLFLRGALPR